jgi:deoxyribodipyrimidine photo-lyase
MDMIEEARLAAYNGKSADNGGKCVLLWMQQAQRVDDNHALEEAIARANRAGVPVVVAFGLTPSYFNANARHYQFMLEGLQETAARLKKRGIKFVLRHAPAKQGPPAAILELVQELCPTEVLCDEGHMLWQREWREWLGKKLDIPLTAVDTDVVMPVRLLEKEMHNARSMRLRFQKLDMQEYLHKLPQTNPRHDSTRLRIKGEDIAGMNVEQEAQRVVTARVHVPAVAEWFPGGPSAAEVRLKEFIADTLKVYGEERNQPAAHATSRINPYLKFGQISPIKVALAVRDATDGKTGAVKDSADSFLEELIVRRELAINFCWFNPEYLSLNCANDWARKTLDEQRKDKREYIYDVEQLENGRTHDPIWNASQKELLVTGRMHNYMRMLWAKKILEWSETPEIAYETALGLNDKYELDGRQAGGYAGVAWAICGKHDRAWGPRRPIFGTIRYMSSDSTRRKYDMKSYIDWVNLQCEKVGVSPVKDDKRK